MAISAARWGGQRAYAVGEAAEAAGAVPGEEEVVELEAIGVGEVPGHVALPLPLQEARRRAPGVVGRKPETQHRGGMDSN